MCVRGRGWRERGNEGLCERERERARERERGIGRDIWLER